MTSAAALFTGEGAPLHDASVSDLGNFSNIICTRPICHILFDADDPAAWQRDDVDLVLALPMGPGPHQLAPEYHAALVAVLDQGGRIALLGTHGEAVHAAIGDVLALAGGGHA